MSSAGPSVESRGRYLTARLPGIGGAIRRRESDFLVEELPLYEPCGEGEHIYLFVEKRGLATTDAARLLAAHFGVPRTAVGYAGMKDKDAVTRQVFSIHTPGRKPEDFPMLRHEKLAVLWSDLHTNKLRLGHLRGNRFSIRVRHTDAANVLRARAILEALHTAGVPNFAGEQRFGYRGSNDELGRRLVLGDTKGLLDALLGPDEAFPELNPEMRARYARGEFAAALEACPRASRPEAAALYALSKGKSVNAAVRAIDHETKRFWITAFQSAIFNRVLARRLEAGTLGALAEGDLAMKHVNGAVFAVDASVAADPATAARLRDFEISPSGPLWGPKMMRAGGEAGAIEDEELARTGVTMDHLERAAGGGGEGFPGARRALRVPLGFPECEGGADEFGQYVRCAFELPAGAFATVVMREVMKPDGADGARRGDAEPEEAPEGQ